MLVLEDEYMKTRDEEQVKRRSWQLNLQLMQLCNRKPEKFRYHDLCDKPEFFLVHYKLS